MTDIINRAKRLFENRYHDEPWLALLDSSQERFWIETDNFTEVCGDFVSEDDTRLAAAAPELAQELAEETYEYAVQVKIGAKWLFLGRSAGGHNFAKNAFWFEKIEKAQGYQLIRGETAPTRIVRRRVSPPEVINE